MILLEICFALITVSLGFVEGVMWSRKGWEAFKWDEHTGLVIQRGIIFASMWYCIWIDFEEFWKASVCFLPMFMFFHNGTIYEVRKRIDIANNQKVSYPKGFFDMTKTPREKKFLGIKYQTSFNFEIRSGLFLVGIVLNFIL